ncbi:UNVERIFIED_CONTAM: hypothetical protein RMT77_007508 [Armadillidium vulgare]
MGALCWKFCPARESCGYYFSYMGRLCCCLGSPSGSDEKLPVDPLADAKDYKLSIRRISRLDSEESLEAFDDPNAFIASQSPPPPTHTMSHKFTKKISLHRRALKSMIKGGGYASSPDLRAQESFGMESKDESFKTRSRLHLPKYFVTSSSDDVMNEDREEVEKRHRIRNLLKDSRKALRGSKDMQQMPGPITLPDNPLLPHLSFRRDLEPFQDGENRTSMGMHQSYGSLLQIPTNREDGSEYAFSDEERTETIGSRSPLGGSQYQLLDDEAEQSHLHESSECISLGVKERGEGDGSVMSVGSKDNPAFECFGSITLTARHLTSKLVNVTIFSLQGLPCRKGKDSGLSLEVLIIPGGKPVWLPLPQAQGPKVTVNSEVKVKSSHQKDKDQLIRVCVWSAGRTWKHCALGNAVLPASEKEEAPSTLGLYQHTQGFQGLGMIEISLEYTSEESKGHFTVQVQRAKFSKELITEKSISGFKSVYKRM